MLFILVKNNLKLMMREKIITLLLIVMPILLISVLSSAFSVMLTENYEIEDFYIGYSIEEGSNIEKVFIEIEEGFNENNIHFKKITKEEAKEQIKNNKIEAYLEIDDNKYILYRGEKPTVNYTVFESSFNSVIYSYDGANTLGKYLVDNGIVIEENILSNFDNDYINEELLDVDPMPSSVDYYGITEIIYIIWIGMMAVTIIEFNEQKYNLVNRINLTKANSLIIFLGKLIPVILLIFLEVGVAVVISKILMGINWGTVPLMSAGIIFLEIVAISTVGLMLSSLIRSQVVVNIIIFITSFGFGFIGGSFQTYMYNLISDGIMSLSPLYYLNRTLIEFSTKGYSDMAEKTITLFLIIIAISSVVGILAIDKRRKAI